MYTWLCCISWRTLLTIFAGISRDQYFAALRGGEELMFVCEPCVHRIPPRDNDRIEVGLFVFKKYSNLSTSDTFGLLKIL